MSEPKTFSFYDPGTQTFTGGSFTGRINHLAPNIPAGTVAVVGSFPAGLKVQPDELAGIVVKAEDIK